MNFNVGGFDRLERILHGSAFILIGIFLVSGLWQYVLGIYGLLRLLTGVFAVCPIYIPFKYTTRK
jgi:cytochrome b subunit of formate dehydrogenase